MLILFSGMMVSLGMNRGLFMGNQKRINIAEI